MLSEALKEAKIAKESCQFPVGCIIELNGKIIGKGHNQAKELNDPTAHAEIQAIKNACQTLGRRNLNGAFVYTTLEPCPMCLYALMISKVSAVIYGAKDPLGGSQSIGANLRSPYHEPSLVFEDNQECRFLVESYFK